MKTGWYRRLRRWWWVSVYGLSPMAAEDLMDGIDLADHDCGFSALPRTEPPEPPGPNRRPRPKRQACPGLRTVDDLDELDAEFLAGGPVADAVARGVARDLKRSALELETLKMVEVLENLAAAWKAHGRDFMANFLWFAAQRVQTHVAHETARRRQFEDVDMTPAASNAERGARNAE